jgi:hypothetical protein
MFFIKDGFVRKAFLANKLRFSILFALLLLKQPDVQADTFRATSSDGADHSCQVILRSAQIVREMATGLAQTETDDHGRHWYVFEADVDAAAAPMKLGASVQLLYRSGTDLTWHTAPALSVPGAAASLQRHQFRISMDTLRVKNPNSGDDPTRDAVLHVIPFMQSSDGRRVFDHNAHPDVADTYTLNSANNWRIISPAGICERAGRGTSTFRFLGDWTHELRGLAQPGQSLVVEYDLNRLPQCQASSYNGLPAWQTEAFIRFYPNGQESSAVLSSIQGGNTQSLPARFDIPDDATAAQLWFRTRGRSCEGAWDSNFGRNYEIALKPGITPSPAWSGQWQILEGGQDCETSISTQLSNEPTILSDQQLAQGCLAVEAEVLVPGLTNSPEGSPQGLQAQVVWKTDSTVRSTQWLTFVGRRGQNFRYRWMLPKTLLLTRDWSQLEYLFQYSTDGLFWLRSGSDVASRIGFVEPRRFVHRP